MRHRESMIPNRGAKRTVLTSRAGGVTILEIMIALVILGIMAAAVTPMAKMTVQRRKEMELRRSLRILRAAIDDYKSMVDQGQIVEEDVEAMGFPPDLETLVEGVQLNTGELTKKKFLRRIPKDPMTNSIEWGLRSYQDEADSRSWGGENVFDVYTLSSGVALDGSNYNEW
ncbi:MAG: type II secretion system protein [Acidobacteriota bacterium]